MTMWRAGVVTTGRRLAAGLLVATAITAAVQAQGAGNLTIAFRANQEPASLDGHIDPYLSVGVALQLLRRGPPRSP